MTTPDQVETLYFVVNYMDYLLYINVSVPKTIAYRVVYGEQKFLEYSVAYPTCMHPHVAYKHRDSPVTTYFIVEVHIPTLHVCQIYKGSYVQCLPDKLQLLTHWMRHISISILDYNGLEKGL